MPDRRIEPLNRIGTLDDEGEGAASLLAAVLNSAVARAVDPLEEPAITHALEAGERVAAKCHAPVGGGANVGAQKGPVNAHGRVALDRKVDSPQRRPQPWARRAP